MKKLTVIIAGLICLLCFIPQASAAAADLPTISNNQGANEPVYYWSDTVGSYLYDNGSGLTRVEYLSTKAQTPTGTGILIEQFDKSYNLLSSKTLTMELPIWGGFYSGRDYNFIIVGQNNFAESNSVEVMRVIRYTKDWKRVDHVGIFGANTYIPFDAGSLRAVQYGNMLYVRTAHEMYASNDGLHHQANVTFSVKIGDKLTVTDSLFAVSNRSRGYSSHSFNQFIDVHGSTLVGVDHGDAYPRSIAIFRYQQPAGQDKFLGYCDMVNAFPIPGQTGANYTGVSLGGFEITDSAYIIAGRSIDQDADSVNSKAENIFITSTPINSFSDEATTVTWLTSNTSTSAKISTPQMLKISGSRLLVMWTENGSFRYTFLDASGKRSTAIYQGTAELSDCKPIIYGNKVIWYVTDGMYMDFYEINLSSPYALKKAKSHAYTGIKLTLNTPVTAPDSESPELYSFTAPADGTYIFTSLGSDSTDTVGWLFDKVTENNSEALVYNDYRYDKNTGKFLEHFYLEYKLSKGETVYLRVAGYWTNSEQYQVVVKQKSTTSTTTKKPTTTTTKKPTTTTTRPTTTTTRLNDTVILANVRRIAGSSRTETAVAISKEAFGTANTVILANGNDFADSLAGAPLAYAMNAPILLVRNSTLDAETTAEISRLGAKKVIILGGELAIGSSVENELRSKGISVERIAGQSRFDTAVAIAERLETVTGKKPTEVFFAFSHGYADALSVSSVAAVKKAPILYISANGVLTDGTKSYVRSSGAGKAYILGGVLAISDNASGSIKAAGAADVERIAGQTRYATCIEINRKFAGTLTGRSICIATGTNFPDALAGGVFAAKNKAPLVLVPASLTNVQVDFINYKNPTDIYIFGGTGAVSQQTQDILSGK